MERDRWDQKSTFPPLLFCLRSWEGLQGCHQNHPTCCLQKYGPSFIILRCVIAIFQVVFNLRKALYPVAEEMRLFHGRNRNGYIAYKVEWRHQHLKAISLRLNCMCSKKKCLYSFIHSSSFLEHLCCSRERAQHKAQTSKAQFQLLRNLESQGVCGKKK